MADRCSIMDLPEEVIFKILHFNTIECRDILNFGSVNRKFHLLIKDNSLWKKKLRIEKNGGIKLADIEAFVELARTGPMGLFCLHAILVDVYIKGDMIHESEYPVQNTPYTLTNRYYASKAIRHLMQVYLMVCWGTFSLRSDEVPSEKVMNFCLNWMDTVDYQPYESVKCSINDLVEEVINRLHPQHPLRLTPADTRDSWSLYCLSNNQLDPISSMQVHAAIRYALYIKLAIQVVPEATLETIDLITVIEKRRGHRIAVASIYESVARRCGVRCQIIAFDDRFFLEWRESNSKQMQGYYIDMDNGKMDRKGSFPLSDLETSTGQRFYRPEILIKVLVDSLIKSRDTSPNKIYMDRARNLLELIHWHESIDYKKYHHLLESPSFVSILKENNSPNFFRVKKAHLDLMYKLCILCRGSDNDVEKRATVYRNRKSSRVQFAVGMVCLLRQYNYECVITGWHIKCNLSAEKQARLGVDQLVHKDKQPFYFVMMRDGSRRYLAQESLTLHSGYRVKSIENALGKEFSHYNGSYYIANAEKRQEYPDEDQVVAAFRRGSGIYGDFMPRSWGLSDLAYMFDCQLDGAYLLKYFYFYIMMVLMFTIPEIMIKYKQ